jgi:hypothetical protein
MRAWTLPAFAALLATATAWAGPNANQDNAPPPPLDEQPGATSPDPNGSPQLGQPQLPPPLQTPADAAATPAARYGRLNRSTCEAELRRRRIGFVPVGEARGVLAPVRLTGPLHGVTYHSALPARQRASSPYEILDCRLVLALDDFSTILARYDVVEVIHFSVYRPPASRWPTGRLGHQHIGGLAIDAGWFKRKDGTVLQVERDFHGHIGASTCGPGTGPHPVTAEATTLRHIVCEAAAAHLFNVELTPDYNWPHRNHFHLEVTPNVHWFLVH